MGVAEIITLVGSIVGLLAGVGSWISSGVTTRQTNEANRQLAAQQNQWNIEQWNRQNAYNTYSAQIDRLKDAGLNPSLAYGSLVSPSVADTVQAADVPSMRPTNLDSSAFDMSSLAGQYQTVALHDAQARYYNELADGVAIDNDRRDRKNVVVIEQAESQIDLNKQQVKNLESSRLFTEHEDARQALLSYDEHLKMQEEILNLKKDGELKQKDIDSYQTKLNLWCQEMRAKIANLNADSAYKNALVQEVMTRVRANDAQYMSFYGTTESDVKKRIDNLFKTATEELGNYAVYLNNNGKQLDINSSAMVFDNFISRFNEVTGAVGNIFSIGVNSSSMQGTYSSQSMSSSTNRNINYNNPNPHPTGRF